MSAPGRVALVTGGAGGLGAAICRTLGRAGMAVACGDVRHDQAERVADSVRGRRHRRRGRGRGPAHPRPTAARLAAAAAAVVVGKEATAACSASELRAALSRASKFCPTLESLAPILAEHRAHGRRIVLTSGCFDLLHPGHVDYLERARARGDVLVVAVNTDTTVRHLKGPDRPVNALEDRVRVLAGLSAVDHVVPFAEDTPVAVVRSVRPDVFAKGADYTLDMLPEAPLVRDLAGIVHLLPLVDGRSTTRTIESIRRPPDVPARPLQKIA